jgi:hypothetical protein
MAIFPPSEPVLASHATAENPATAGRVEVVRSLVRDLPDRLGRTARNWCADRRFDGEDRVTVQIGLAADPATVEAMARAAEGILGPVAQRVRRWISERTEPAPDFVRATSLHADFLGWCASEGLPPMGVAALARRLYALGVEGCLHSRTRQSRFRLRLRPDHAPIACIGVVLPEQRVSDEAAE